MLFWIVVVMGSDASWTIISQESVAAIVFVVNDYSEQSCSSHCFGKAFPVFLHIFLSNHFFGKCFPKRLIWTKKRAKIWEMLSQNNEMKMNVQNNQYPQKWLPQQFLQKWLPKKYHFPRQQQSKTTIMLKLPFPVSRLATFTASQNAFRPQRKIIPLWCLQKTS